MRLSVLYLLHVLVAVSVIHADLSTCTAHPDGTSTAHTHTSAIPRSSSKKQIGGKARKALILDVDNCLYSESEIKAAGATGMGIEQQIIDRTHQFGEKELNLTKEECDNMYLSHGSTIEGIRHKLTSEGYAEERIRVVLSDYYQKVYDGIDMTCLLPLQSSINMNTGYNHARSRTRRRVIRDMLQHMPHPIYFASNSPKQHVLKVLSALGLKDVPYEGLLTPDTIHVGIGVGVGGDGDGGDGDGKVQKLDFPTKFHPSEFFQSLLDEYDAEEMILVDDSTNNLKKAKEIGIQGLQVNSNSAEGGLNLEEALSIFAGHVESGGEKDAYEFSDVKYLQSKNEVDKIAIHSDVWTQVSSRLFQNLSDNGNAVESCVRIVDVGAGLLSMLELVLVGGGGKEPLVQHMKRGMTLEYIAYESNVNLIEACLGRLRALGFEGIPVGGIDSDDKEEYTFVKKAVAESDVEVKVILRVKDFAEHCLGKDERPHLIVGCCFADLFEPNELVSAIARFANYYTNGGGIGMDHSNNSNRLEEILVYFPITFSGTTQFVPPKPFEVNAGDDTIIPSDTIAFQLYADSLIQEHGHNLDPTAIVEAMKDVGASMIKSATSVWHIDPTENSYLWNTMLYFFGNSAAPQLMKRQLDSSGWVDRARTNRPIIRVMNQDLLFALPATGADSSSLRADVEQEEITCEEPSASAAARKTMQEIEFQSPNKVGKKIRDIVQLGPGQVEVKSICSLISSGTELKIFKGLFDEAALDVNIKGMTDESMKYPLSYGYSLVGVVTRCGDEVADAQDLIGKIVFTFSSHSTNAIVDRDAIQIVPDGISPEDAIFLPSVETALSIVHDAHVRVGEKVAIYGQGLIGLLVNAILSQQQIPSVSGQFGTVTVFDTISDRLAMASVMGASQALMPMDASSAGPYDVSIEVSGNFRALQSAIDFTRNGGRVIVGSWYGNADVNLKLGIDFHRSHKTIKTSQVSTIPADLSTLWSKDRRFSLTWELVRMLRPSRLITKSVTLDEAQEAYERLEKGLEIAVSFVY